MIETYEKLSSMFQKPISRFFIKRGLTPDSFAGLENHVMPLLPERLEGMKAGKWDTITRGAPAMLLFHAAPDAGKAAEDAVIALTYGLLAAHALGLGATAIGQVPPVVERSAKLKALFHIPEENKVYSSMMVGFPRLRFLRGIRRTFPEVDWVGHEAA